MGGKTWEERKTKNQKQPPALRCGAQETNESYYLSYFVTSLQMCTMPCCSLRTGVVQTPKSLYAKERKREGTPV